MPAHGVQKEDSKRPRWKLQDFLRLSFRSPRTSLLPYFIGHTGHRSQPRFQGRASKKCVAICNPTEYNIKIN